MADTARRVELPDWPRAMPLPLAAAYVGGLSQATFLREVVAGRLPKPFHVTTGRVAWAREDLDAFIDGRKKAGETYSVEAIEAEFDRWVPG